MTLTRTWFGSSIDWRSHINTFGSMVSQTVVLSCCGTCCYAAAATCGLGKRSMRREARFAFSCGRRRAISSRGPMPVRRGRTITWGVWTTARQGRSITFVHVVPTSNHIRSCRPHVESHSVMSSPRRIRFVHVVPTSNQIRSCRPHVESDSFMSSPRRIRFGHVVPTSNQIRSCRPHVQSDSVMSSPLPITFGHSRSNVVYTRALYGRAVVVRGAFETVSSEGGGLSLRGEW